MTTITIKLSEQAIQRSLKQQEITQIKGSGEPFLMRPHKCRTRGSWYFVSHKGGTKRHKIANYPDLSVKGLLAIKDHLVGKWVKEESVSQSEFETVGELLSWYRDRAINDKNLSKSRRTNIKSVVNRHLLPMLSDWKLSEITRSQVDEQFIWVMQQDYALSYVRHNYVLLRKIFKQARQLNKIEHDPMSNWSFSDFCQAKIKPKGSKLKESNIPKLVEQIKRASAKNGTMILFMLSHGTRIGETRRMKWDYIDVKNKRITIPAEITKTKVELTLPITDWMQSLLDDYRVSQRATGYTGGYLFNALNGGAVNEMTANDMVRSVSDCEWTAHDLRKLARSMWADLGVDYMVSEMLLNHALTKMDRAYIHTYVEVQKKSALELWHSYIAKAMAT